jgi:hypothetical protein
VRALDLRRERDLERQRGDRGVAVGDGERDGELDVPGGPRPQLDLREARAQPAGHDRRQRAKVGQPQRHGPRRPASTAAITALARASGTVTRTSGVGAAAMGRAASVARAARTSAHRDPQPVSAAVVASRGDQELAHRGESTRRAGSAARDPGSIACR